MKKGKQKFVGIIVWVGLIVLAITLPQIDYQVAGVVATIIGLVGLVAVFKPLKRVGLDKRAKAFFLVAISLVMIIGSAQVFRADQDQILAGLKDTDTQQYLIKLKEFRGEEVWLEELKVLDPIKYDLERAKITTEAEEGKARAVAAAHQETCRSDDARFDAYIAAQQFVIEQLKAPSTAEFPARRDITILPSGVCSFEVTGFVDAQNAFGAMIRTRYQATLTRDESNTSRWRLGSLQFLDQ